MALLAAYAVCGKGKILAEFLEKEVFADMEKSTAIPEEKGVKGFETYMERYKSGFKFYKK